jgi:hypothetical protein
LDLPDSLVYEKFYDFEKTWSRENNDIRKSLLEKSKMI